MRTTNSIKNILVAASGQILNILITFISRTLFIKILGIEYLGVNGLFTNILTIISLAELGIGTSIIYSLYKPIATGDYGKIKALMNFYKITYRIIGIVVIILGLVLTPYIELFISNPPEINNLRLIFLLFVFSTAATYFNSYKRAMIGADQKQYIVSVYQSVFIFIQNIFQIIVLYITENYVVYLVVQILLIVFQNIVISKKADKLYPFLKEKNAGKIDKETMHGIKRNVSAMVFHKMGSMVVSSTDNILISKMINISVVGLYSNYSLIINAINGLLVQIFSSITASVGNLGVTTSEEYTQIVFKRVLFLNFWIYAFCSVMLFTLINPFIELWIGQEMLLGMPVITVIIANFYLSGMRRTVLTFREALGLYWYDRYKPIAESIINLVASVILARKFGLIGVFIGTTISTVTTSFWIEPLILYIYGFKRKGSDTLEYFTIITKGTIIFSLVLMITYKSSELIIGNSIFSFFSKVLVSTILPNLLFTIIFWKNKHFKWFTGLILNNMKKK